MLQKVSVDCWVNKSLWLSNRRLSVTSLSMPGSLEHCKVQSIQTRVSFPLKIWAAAPDFCFRLISQSGSHWHTSHYSSASPFWCLHSNRSTWNQNIQGWRHHCRVLIRNGCFKFCNQHLFNTFLMPITVSLTINFLCSNPKMFTMWTLWLVQISAQEPEPASACGRVSVKVLSQYSVPSLIVLQCHKGITDITQGW